MMHRFGYRLEELENMLPWERDVYTGLLISHLLEKKESREREKLEERNR